MTTDYNPQSLIVILDFKVISKRPLKVAQVFYEILIIDNLDHFTISDFRESYMAKFNDVELVESHKKVYRQVLRLYKLGMLSKTESHRVKEHSYHKTKLFYEIGLVPKHKITVNNEARYSSINALLEERLKKCEVDLITSLSESDEYMNLFKSLPELQDILQANYLRSKEYSSKLLGQIKALKSVIKNQAK